MADREQQHIIRSIIEVGRRRGMPRQAILAALEAGSVETRFRNLPGGDRDSQGWRQERAQYYRNPRNVHASINRWYDEWEADAKGRGLSVGQQAQAVQQSGFPDRYATKGKLAKRLLRQYGGQGSGGSTRTTVTRTPGIDNSGLRQSLKLDYLENRHDPDALLNLGLGLKDAVDVSGSVTRTTQRIPGASSRGPIAGNGVPVNEMLRKAVKWDRAKAPYLWGGGHGSIAKPGQPVDCSGFVSAVLGLETPLVSGQLAKWGNPGRGKHVTVWANDGHVLIQIGNKWFGTSKSNPGGGAGRIAPPPPSYLKGFVARHPS